SLFSGTTARAGLIRRNAPGLAPEGRTGSVLDSITGGTAGALFKSRGGATRGGGMPVPACTGTEGTEISGFSRPVGGGNGTVAEGGNGDSPGGATGNPSCANTQVAPAKPSPTNSRYTNWLRGPTAFSPAT